ncbi:hypothetical protein ACP_2436 [Acidobacterium capsulatum ATCC 51196]|uniref:Uncharacterized protein n=1 Tax=Acidobacterium capsulatum (strain ATCC 51196 / DSM 11244 / BCRC 80197 / JCM 7670 / NBRC 15755 / NCIMB 13165 / 161) TaxID=240015 RepID=C1F1D1_ACIC5|nr:hypothetical protein ACP_2436 [Acidobacterium capsulatum ATCC 51196]
MMSETMAARPREGSRHSFSSAGLCTTGIVAIIRISNLDLQDA